jgi:peroxiredoxin
MRNYFLSILFSCCLLFIHSNIYCQSETENTNSSDTSQTLQNELDAKRKEFESKAGEEKKRIYSEGIQAVIDAGTLQNAKNVGDEAPDFVLKNALGENVSLSSYLKQGPVILTWYRGGWCPYCNITLHRLQQELPDFKSAGANLIALTPELPDKSLSTIEKHQLQFEVLSDVGNKVARTYGIVFKLTPEVAESYQKGFDLHSYNGDESNELPLAATYVINTNGKIIYAFLDADYKKRAEPADIINALNSLSQ